MGKKEGKSRGLDILIYFWDNRDGDDLAGWWFGPNVGGEQVWAYHPSQKGTIPPTSDWNVPHDGEIDPTFSVIANKDDKVSKEAGKSEKKDDKDAGKNADFVKAYNKRREERLAAEAKDKDTKKGDKAEKDGKALSKEEEEEKKQMEELKRRAAERRKKAEEKEGGGKDKEKEKEKEREKEKAKEKEKALAKEKEKEKEKEAEKEKEKAKEK